MKVRFYYFLVVFGVGYFLTTTVSAQQKQVLFGNGHTTSIQVPLSRTCYTTEIEQKLQTKYPDRFKEQQFEETIQTLLDQKARSRSVADEVYYIPTIVHVVHNGETIGSGSNISYEQVMSQFEVLNEDFRRLGNGTNDHPDGADSYIEFYPVLQNPDGVSLNEEGINRIDGEKAFWGEVDIETNLKPNTVWDPERYFNIWVVPFGGDLDGVLGYAQFPSLSGLPGLASDEGPAQTDGVVIGHQFFGTTGSAVSPFDLGRTTTHEVGHWLGLRHIWGDGGCSDDDYCADTPPASEPNYQCQSNDSCPSDELMDMIENYMDYSDDGCMNLFTQDQKARMRIVLENSPRRQSLIQAQCSDAEEAIAGTNSTDTRGWYSYMATSSSIVTLSSIGQTDNNTLVRVFSSCSSSPIISSDDAFDTDQSEVALAMEQGESVLFYWGLIGDEGTFNWTLTETDQVSAGACDLAESATLGMNSIPATDLNEYWYHYQQSDADSKLTISSPNGYQVFVGNCDELKLLASGSGETVLTEVAQSESVFIQFDASGGDFDWTLVSEPLDEGEGCSTATTAAEGINNTTFKSHWYIYTMPQFGYLTLSSSGQSVGTNVTVYGDCDQTLLAENQDDGNGQSDLTLALDEGDEIRILWENTSSGSAFVWELQIEDVPPGQECSNAVVITTGEQTIESDLDVFWTTYTVQNSDSKLVIETEEDVDIYVVSDCEGTLVYGSGYQTVQAAGMSQGEVVYVVWDLSFLFDSGPVDFTLREEAIQDGDICSQPKEAVVGVNESTKAPYWYTYTMPKAGDARISSRNSKSDTYLFVSAECGGTVLSENDDIDFDILQSELLLEGLEDGEEIIIYWSNQWSSKAFSWELSLENVNNSAPVVQNTTITISELGSGVQEIGQINASDPDGDPLYYQIASGNEQNIFSIDENGLLFADFSLWSPEVSSMELNVDVTDRIEVVSITVTIQLLILGMDDHQETIYPNPTSGIIYLNSEKVLGSGEVLDLSGQVVMRFHSKVIDLSSLKDGIYFVRVSGESEMRSFRVILNKD